MHDNFPIYSWTTIVYVWSIASSVVMTNQASTSANQLFAGNHHFLYWFHIRFRWSTCKKNATEITFTCLPAYKFTDDDVIKWKYFPRNWPFVRGIHRSPVNSPHKGQWRGALMFSLIWAWINGCVNNHEAGDSRWHRASYDVAVM